MKASALAALAVALLLSCALQLQALPIGTVIFSDNFDSRNTGQLEGQSPWIIDYVSCGAGNAQVTPGQFSIPNMPGSTKYATGRVSGSDGDGDLVNLAYHYGGGHLLSGDFAFSWNFYDPIGAGSAANTFQDSMCLSLMATLPLTKDPTSGIGTGAWSGNANRIMVGATSVFTANPGQTCNTNVYQVRQLGATGAYNDQGWCNTTVARSVGWHQATIDVLSPNANGTNLLKIYIDNTLVFNQNSTNTGGFNCLEMLTATAAKTGAFDNISITTIPEPSSILALGMGFVGLLGLIKRRK